jgi:dolichol-phosphate mannosyltransferase
LVKTLGIIIPVYNEGENIRKTIDSIEEKITTSHLIYIVYDFDEDNTIPIAKKFIKNGVDIQFVKNPIGGAVNAIKVGFQAAKEDYLLVTMADLSDDYTVVDRMCQLMSEGYDIICGSRYMKGGRQIGGHLLKKTLSRMVGLSLRYVAGLPTHDATNSFKLYRKGIIDSIEVESDGGFEIGLEVVIKAHFSGFRVIEVPCIWKDRSKGKSRFKIIKWAPNYLRWYFYALKKALYRANRNAPVN